MRPFASIARKRVAGLAFGGSLLVLACSSSGKSPSGNGGMGAGGVTETGGAPTQPDAASHTGGTIGVGGSDTGQSSSGGGSGAGATIAGRSGSGGGGATAGGPGSGGIATGRGDAGPPDTAAAGGGARDGSVGGSTGTEGGAGSAAAPSAGCGNKAYPASNRYNITVGGASREYILKIPASYDPNHPYRLIFGFHGAKYSDDWVATGKAPAGGTDLSGPYFGIESESAGSAIFVAPQAGASGWGAGDLAFVDTMLAQFETQLCIDQNRIFSVGFSMGAIMTLRIACERSDVFRGVAPMSGSLPSPCSSTGTHIAYWASHGTNDTTIPISQGQAARDEFVKRNHCGTQTSAADTNNCVTYQGCEEGYPVTWCTFAGVHDPAPFAGPEIWSFFAPL